MQVAELIRTLNENGVYPYVESGKLKTRSDRADLAAELVQLIRHNRDALIAFLSEAGFGTDVVERIPPRGNAASAPLSFAQQRLCFVERFDQAASAAYHMPAAMRLRGDLDRSVLQQVLDRIVARHEILRTTFASDAGEPLQRIGATDCGFVLREHDLTSLPPRVRETTIESIGYEETHAPFDLVHGPLIRGRLLRLAADEHVLLVTQHHIVSDGWSRSVLVREVCALYTAFVQGQPDPLPPLPAQYGDYAQWQRARLQGPVLEQHMGYWRERLAGIPALHSLPLDLPRPAQQRFDGGRVEHTVDASVVAGLKSLAQGHDASLFMALQAAFAVLLSRWSGETDVVVGSPVSGRVHKDVESLIGFFVNTLVLRTDLQGEPDFAALLTRVRAEVLGAFDHQEIPFEMLVEELRPERSLSHAPLCQVSFTLQNDDGGNLQLPGLAVEPLADEYEQAKVDLQLTATESVDGLRLSWVYARSLFERTTIERMSRAFSRLLAAIVAKPHTPVSRLALLSDGDLLRITQGFNATTAMIANDLPAHRWFEHQAVRQPQATAVVCGGDSVGYGELNRRANAVAHRLIAEGVGRDDRVGICLSRGIDMVTGLLAVLKAGAAYVPLDPTLPDERIAWMLRDCEPRAVLTHSMHSPRLLAATAPVLPLDREDFAGQPDSDPQVDVQGQDLAYVLYTSGSTGTPKGVMVHHGGLQNYLHYAHERYLHDGIAGALVATPFGFDATVTTLMAPWLAGSVTVLLAEDSTECLMQLLEHARSDRRWLFKLTPAHLDALANLSTTASSTAHRVVVGGEQLSWRTLARFRDRVLPLAEVVNEYGPTETVVGCTTHFSGPNDVQSSGDAVSIGRPIANARVYLLDAHGASVPVGVVGEIHVAGQGVTRGYLGRAELTAERFLADPFSGTPDARLYRTGDLARWAVDGSLEYVGRNDFQVKIRGFRIELGEIEAQLAGCAGVRDAVVDARPAVDGDNRLVAYVVPENGADLSSEALRDALARAVPDYMLPSAYVFLDALPLTANGKVDRRALPAPDLAALTRAAFEAPEGEVEGAIAALWQRLLGVGNLGRNDDFFELGGHSLLATRVVGEIAASLGRVVPVRALFEAPRLRQFAARVEAESAQTPASIPLVDRDSPLPLSFAQQRLWFVDRLEGGSAQYNITAALRLSGDLDPRALQQALDALVRRHEVLRTNYAEVDGVALQTVRPPQSVAIAHHDLGALSPEAREQRVRDLSAQESSHVLDLARDPILRCSLLKLGRGEHVLLLTVHHIASDGASRGVMVRELTALYSGFACGTAPSLPPLKLQYADYAAWQRQRLQGATLRHHLDYWRQQLGEIPAVHSLPLDRARPAQQSFDGGRWSHTIDIATAAGLKSLARRHGASLFMVLQGAFAVLLSRWSGQSDIVIGSPIAGRLHKDVEPLIGFFINSLVLRTDLSGNPDFLALLRQVRSTALAAYEHQEVPFDLLVDELKPERSLNHPPLFQISFTLHNLEDVALDLPGLRFTSLDPDADAARFDIELHICETDNGLQVSWLYATSLFDHATIERLAGSFVTLLQGIVATPEQLVSALPLLPAAEQGRIAQWSATPRIERPALCAHELFEAQVLRDPDAVAAVFDGETLRYGDLNRQANRVARYLVEQGVGPETMVGLCVERSLDMVVGVLGILKAGAAYLPLDPTYPEERIAEMLDDSGVEHVLTQSAVLEALACLGEKTVLPLDGPMREALLAGYADDNLAVADIGLTPSNLAYVIYTSGSTGKPKGVLLEHRGLINLAAWQQRELALTPHSRVLAFASMSFDGAAWEWVMALANGASLYICDQDDRQSVDRLASYLVKHRITHAAIPPALLAHVDPTRDYALEVLVVSGEACEERLAWTWAQRCRVCNSYGPSEATVAATHADIRPGERIVLGGPLDNVQLHVVNALNQPQPIGVPGELLIGGDGLARGYLHRDDLTAERFIAHPHTCGQRLYRTGDLACWLPNGDLQFLGRADDQVKIRGFRVELGEVENHLRTHDRVREALVVVRDEASANKRLVAYVVLDSAAEDELPNEVLLGKLWRAHLKQWLPDYMVPAAFVLIDQIPLTANGKIDKRRLPEPDYQAQQTYMAPGNEIEAKLAAIWQQVLRVELVGVHDNFFEIGGDSILSIQVVSRANQAGITITTKQLFEAQTIADLAQLASTEAGVVAPQEAVQGEQILLPIHHLFLGISEQGRDHYNMAVLLQTPVDFDPDALPALVEALYGRHDALRLRFDRVDGEWHGRYAPLDRELIAAGCAVEPLPEDPVAATEFLASRCDHWHASFDLAQGPLLRAVYFPAAGAATSGRLLFAIHHAVVDGVSWRVLLADLEHAYAQHARGETIQLPAKTSSFQQWGRALAELAASDVLQDERAYWLAQAGEHVPALPVDRAMQGLGTGASTRTVGISLDAARTRALQQHCNTPYRTQINELLLAGVYLGMRRWTGERSLRLRLDGHGREDLFGALDITQTVGYFTSVHPLSLHCDGSDAASTIKAVKEQVRAIPNRGIGYGVLRYLARDPAIVAAADMAGEPELEFNYLGQFDQVLNADTLFQAADESVGRKESPLRSRSHQLGLSGKVFDGTLSFLLDYSSDQYDESTMRRLAGLIEEGLRQVIDHCMQPDAGALTPADFPLAHVSQVQLDGWQASYPGIGRLYPATPMQVGLHYESALDPATYVVQIWPVLKGALDVDAFRAAWEQVVARHDILRTAFVGEGESLHQLVQDEVALPWHQLDWRGLSASEQQELFDSYRRQDRERGFDFARAPMLRIALCRLDDDRYQLLWSQHHILSDGWSSPLIYRDVMRAYQALVDGGSVAFDAAPIYEQYIAWLQRQDRVAAADHWRAQLQDVDSPTSLAIDHRPADGAHGERQQRLCLDASETRALQALAQTHRLTVNTLLQWAWGHLLHRYSGQSTVVFGATVSGRPAEVPGIEEMVGLFINTLPVKIEFAPGRDLLDHLGQLHRDFQHSNDHGYLSLSEIQRLSTLPPGNPLFDSLLVFENLPVDAEVESSGRRSDLEVESIASRQNTHYRLTLIAMLHDQLQIRFGYRAEHFSEATIARLVGHLRQILVQLPSAVANNGRLELLGADEHHQLREWNQTDADYPSDSTVHAQFEAQAARTPDAIALGFEGVNWSYAEVNRRANRLAHRLLAVGVQPDDRVALCAPRSADSVVAMLAILKAGGAYVPLEADAPLSRLAQLVADCEPVALLAPTDLRAQFAGHTGALPLLWHDDAADQPEHDPQVPVLHGRHLAYVIYTSGSTGEPKGVMVEHRSVLRLAINNHYAPVDEQDCVAHCANPAFDASTWEVWSALLNGARLQVIAQDTVLDLASFRAALIDANVTALWLTVGLFNEYVDQLGAAFAGLDHLLIGGDALDPRTVAQLLDGPHRPKRLVNGYGPTETTTFAVTHEIERSDADRRSIPIGRPIANTRVYVLDAQRHPVPVEVPGELYIGGPGVARGYLKRPELTVDCFIDDPFHPEAGARLYRTGDRVRWLADGTIEYLGRNDAQVKIRGFRVELGEIEARLAQSDGVRNALVIARSDAAGSKRLVAYVAADAVDGLAERLRRELSQQLPSYMVPSALVVLDQLPLTRNGKVDRSALPEPDLHWRDEHVEPATETELRLAAIWCDVLDQHKVSATASFFELGGHSLLATRVVSAVRSEFGTVLKIKDLFENPTIAALAGLIDALDRHAITPWQDNATSADVLEEMEW